MQIFFFPVSPTERLPLTISGADPEGGVPGARPPLKLEKIRFFGVFSHEIPQKFSRLPPLGPIF